MVQTFDIDYKISPKKVTIRKILLPAAGRDAMDGRTEIVANLKWKVFKSGHFFYFCRLKTKKHEQLRDGIHFKSRFV
jgi:hypothetical protein